MNSKPHRLHLTHCMRGEASQTGPGTEGSRVTSNGKPDMAGVSPVTRRRRGEVDSVQALVWRRHVSLRRESLTRRLCHLSTGVPAPACPLETEA